MSASAAAQKASTPEPAASEKPQATKMPSLIAFYAVPVPAGAKPVLVPIGGAVEHEDGEGFTLDLNLMPTTGGRIVLRKPLAQK